jgi:hypothetical protein
MTTLAADTPLPTVTGDLGSVPIIAADTVFEGAMVGDNGAGYGRPLTAGDVFRGHAIAQVENESGSAGDKNIQVQTGKYRKIVPLVGLITDVGQPVYASDDAVVTFDSAGNSFVGRISRYESATKMEVEFETGAVDEFGRNAMRETKSDDYTTDAADNGKIISLGVDTKTITLIATVAGYEITIINSGGFGTALVTVDFNAADKSLGGCDLAAGADGAHITNTKATQQRGDFIKFIGDGSAGWNIVAKRGIWVQS